MSRVHRHELWIWVRNDRRADNDEDRSLDCLNDNGSLCRIQYRQNNTGVEQIFCKVEVC